jgi:hypothetical protein
MRIVLVSDVKWYHCYYPYYFGWSVHCCGWEHSIPSQVIAGHEASKYYILTRRCLYPFPSFIMMMMMIHTACYKQVSNYDGTISDCTAVLEVEPQNVKALLRRAQAFEGVERYRFALQDVKTVLAMPYHLVGKQNFDLCNGMQHRLQRTVNQLKQMN